ncbi:type VI secretion system baseplate subunit TssF [Duganella sp. FT3S]|uniref:Type VI secretion system baseplate subunit TssF n=1 Tax=Rugamonas fusca TaxID=2758568 RepID=A0A7W2EJJ4_9BURK|nr:type VI secretion system baseplate subunit TssF [Rugamonas fusca]MBA5607048.1 type VI secretion system baseplate subunit TssF [Rugamonas fusca]
MKSLVPYYERELGRNELLAEGFSVRHPKLADKLGIRSEAGGDPQTGRVLQSVALLGARTVKLLDDDYSRITAALLNVLRPHYLRPIPAASVACLDFGRAKENAITGVSVIPRGTELKCVDPAAHACKYTTAYPVTIGPYRISDARFDAIVKAPAAVALSGDVTSQIKIEIRCTASNTGLAALGLDKIRVYIAGEPSFGATLRDTLFMRTVSTYVEADGSGEWTALDQPPLVAVGFADGDAMIPFAPSEHPVHRLLAEYFSYPAKFRFIDLHLAALLPYLPAGCQRVTVHFVLAGVFADSNAARILKRLSADNLLLGCTPVINLFKTHATPIRLTHERSEYPLLPYEGPVENYEIYSVDSVQLLRKSAKGSVTTEFTPYYALRHGADAGAKAHYYLVHRDEELAELSPGHEYAMAFVDGDFSPLAAATGTASIALTCTNRALPCSLPYGATGGDLAIEGGTGNFPIRLLYRPTAPHRLTSANGAQWGLISSLSLNHRSLSTDGLPAFAAMLELYAPSDCPVAKRQIEGIVDLSHRPIRVWLRDGVGAAYLSGIEVTVTLDEDAYAGCGVHTFIQLLDHFFALYVHLNSFTQLVVLSKSTGKELLRCLPRNGALSLV